MRPKISRTILVPSFFLTIFIFVNLSAPAMAFYKWQGDKNNIELLGMLRCFGTAYENPRDSFFYKDKSKCDIASLARFIMQGQVSQDVNFEINAYQSYMPGSLVTSQFGLGTSLDIERSSLMEWSFSNERHVHLAIDRLNIHLAKDPLDLILGRQPVNLSTTFFFSPNDFFAPFAAQTFYRVYKPGVDAVRAEIRLGDLSQLSLIGVLGYGQDPYGDTGWSNNPEIERTSYIGRISTVFLNFEWSLIGGAVREVYVIGGSLQGELFQWLGLRAEANTARPDIFRGNSSLDFTVGLEHRWPNSLDIRFEHFYHSSGIGSSSDYRTIAIYRQSEGLYIGRNYSAVGVGYEFTPLLNAEMSILANMVDISCLWSFNFTYSLSNESELVFNFGIPIGEKPEHAEIKSEFGLYPYSSNIEIRYYF